MENQTFIAEITDPEMTANEFYHSIPCFIQILEKHGYIGTTLKLAKHALTALYLFLDIHGGNRSSRWLMPPVRANVLNEVSFCPLYSD